MTSSGWVFWIPNPRSAASFCNCTTHLESGDEHCGHWTASSEASYAFRPQWLRGNNCTCICLLEAFERSYWEVPPLPTCFSDSNGYIVVGSGDFRSLWNVSWFSRGKNCLQNASFKIVWCVIETLSHWHSITKAQAQAKPRKTFQQRSW